MALASNCTKLCAKIAAALELKGPFSTVHRVLTQSEHIQNAKMKELLNLKPQHKVARADLARQHSSWTQGWHLVKTQKTPNLDVPYFSPIFF